jgi:isoleucyl-tRNA synthetase
MKTLGPKFGPRLQEAKAAIEGLPAAVIEKSNRSGTPLEIAMKNGPVMLDAADYYTISFVAEDGWAGVADRGTQVALDTHISEELALEGLAREIVRHVQDARKNAGLEMEDRIALVLSSGSDKLNSAIAAHRDSIATETLTARWPQQIDNGSVQSDVKIDGQPLQISLAKV